MSHSIHDFSSIIEATRRHVRETLPLDATGHDWQHVFRVTRTALAIARSEGADPIVVELAALLHDIADWKFHNGDHEAGSRAARQWLAQHHVPVEVIDEVAAIIDRLSFKGAGVDPAPLSLAGQCVQDADRLDAIGAIGVARALAYGGYKSRPIFDPEHLPVLHDSFAAYKGSVAPSLNHFFEKLLLLKDRLQTNTGKQLAAERHEFLVKFVRQFFAEWSGEEQLPAWDTWRERHGI